MKIYILNVPLQNSAITSENNSFWNESATKNSEAGCFSAHLKRKKKNEKEKKIWLLLWEVDSEKRILQKERYLGTQCCSCWFTLNFIPLPLIQDHTQHTVNCVEECNPLF